MKILGTIDGAKNVKQDSNNRFVTDAEKAKWNKKLDRIDLKEIEDKLSKINFTETIAIDLPILDHESNAILDSNGRSIEGVRIYKLQ